MKHLKHFFIYSFRWQLKSLIVVSFFSVFLLILVSKIPSSFSSYIFGFACAQMIYSTLYAGSLLSNLGMKHNQFGSSFSGNYLLSLPISKKNLIFYMMIFNVFSFIPAIFSILWIAFFWNANDFNTSSRDRAILLFINEHFIISILIYMLGCFGVLAFYIRRGIEAPRKLYNKGTLQSYLLNIREGFVFVAYVYAITMVSLVAFVTRNYFIILAALFFFAAYEIYKTYKTMVDESLSYWVLKRDFIKILIIIIVVGGTIGVLITL